MARSKIALEVLSTSSSYPDACCMANGANIAAFEARCVELGVILCGGDSRLVMSSYRALMQDSTLENGTTHKDSLSAHKHTWRSKSS